MFQQFIVLAQSVFWYATKLLSQPEYRRNFLMNSFVRETQICIDWQFCGLTKCNTRTHAHTHQTPSE